MKAILIVSTVLLVLVRCETIIYDDLPEFLSVKKRENDESFEQCAPVNFSMSQLGVVNVLAFLNNSWAYSHKQASMLKNLKDRLERSGVPESLFFVIQSESLSSSAGVISEEEVERGVWEGVAPEEARELTSGLLPSESLKDTLTPDIILIEDTEELGIWKTLGGSRDQILIIDRCGKLAYQVIVPWSILHLPYVKAAILSTHNDDPCGPCDIYATVVEFEGALEGEKPLETDPEETTETNSEAPSTPSEWSSQESSVPEDVAEPVLPSLRIIMHAPHYHADSDKRNEYLILETDQPNYHGHLAMPAYDTDSITEEEEKTDFETSKLGSIVYGKDESPGLYGEVSDYWREEEAKNLVEVMSSGIADAVEDVTTIPDLTDEGSTTGPDFTVEEEVSRSRLIAHYSKLLPWIYFILND